MSLCHVKRVYYVLRLQFLMYELLKTPTKKIFASILLSKVIKVKLLLYKQGNLVFSLKYSFVTMSMNLSLEQQQNKK